MSHWIMGSIVAMCMAATAGSVVVSCGFVFSSDCKKSDRSAENRRRSGDVQRLISAARTANDWPRLGAIYNEVIPHLSRKELEDLSAGPNTGLALQANFEMHNHWVDAKEPAREIDMSTSVILDKQHKGRFLKFLKARAGVKAPKWWVAAFEKPNTHELMTYQENELGEQLASGILEVNEDVSIVERGSQILVKKGKSQSAFPLTIVDVLNKDTGFGRWVDRCTADVSGDTGVLGFV